MWPTQELLKKNNYVDIHTLEIRPKILFFHFGFYRLGDGIQPASRLVLLVTVTCVLFQKKQHTIHQGSDPAVVHYLATQKMKLSQTSDI